MILVQTTKYIFGTWIEMVSNGILNGDFGLERVKSLAILKGVQIVQSR